MYFCLDKPSTLLADTESKFYALCQATGRREFKTLKRMAQGELKTKRPPMPKKKKSRAVSTNEIGRVIAK